MNSLTEKVLCQQKSIRGIDFITLRAARFWWVAGANTARAGVTVARQAVETVFAAAVGEASVLSSPEYPIKPAARHGIHLQKVILSS